MHTVHKERSIANKYVLHLTKLKISLLQRAFNAAQRCGPILSAEFIEEVDEDNDATEWVEGPRTKGDELVEYDRIDLVDGIDRLKQEVSGGGNC